MASKRKKVSLFREIPWGFSFLVFAMSGLSVFLVVSADNRFSGVEWKRFAEDYTEESVAVDGFMVVDLSDAVRMDTRGMAFAAQFLGDPGEEEEDEPEAETEKSRRVGAPVAAGGAFLPENVSEDSFYLLNPVFPPIGDSIGAFGPLPKDLADFESIILSTAENGTRMPEDEPLDDLPGEGFILAEVGPNWKEHVVKAGETLSDIALQYGGVTIQDILGANGLKDANRLAEQQILLIPNAPGHVESTLEEVRTRQARVAALREKTEPLQLLSYVVAAGDSLWSIANAQNLEVDTLVGSNVFKSSVLHPGTVLRIPNQDGIFYKFKNGDKIEAIAKRYHIALDKIRGVNPTTDLLSLKAGSEIFLPGARPEAIVEASGGGEKTASKGAAGSSSKASRVYRWPVMGKINSPFGWRRHPITRRRDFHTGLDIKAARGTVIRSAREGRVDYAGWMGGYGKVVVVGHGNGQSTLYAHCSTLLVKQGEKVSTGQNIARVGTTGRTTGPHLHFEVRNGNTPVNPLKYLK
ncbi:MAG: LysM peptidoglycan-binding domain-containing M23 family metallopeptidase [Synergistaceae bacterium]|jgi:murein DD-endopeptidase MepM/ murein hydrolase activator NlpD/nucleoid-associated protein YgaU|nr:LysM peptidoglycan-binding domain-containing M23 family metallopeptidase [Synergistaceae bacterium]